MTTTYNTPQQTIVNYAVGSGGNFLISCLFLFDRVAHWSKAVQDKRLSYQEWADQTWNRKIDQWVFNEPRMPWNITCYSRRLERGTTLSQTEYDLCVTETASPYFQECWNNGLTIVERWNKGFSPLFLNRCRWIDIIVDDSSTEIYKFLLSKKLFIWHEQNKTILSKLDDPELIKSKYAGDKKQLSTLLAFGNKYEIPGYNDFDDFYDAFLVKQPWINRYLTNDAINHGTCISLRELVNFELFDKKFQELEDMFAQNIDRGRLRSYHDLWIARSLLKVFCND